MNWLWRNITTVLLGITLLVAAAGQAVGVFDRSDIDQGEGPLLAMIVRMWREPISFDWVTGSECTLICYGPVYLWATMGMQAISGVYDSLVPGRFVSLAATWATALLLAWAIRRQTRMTNMALAAALLYMISTPIPWWGHVHRVDALAVFFSIAGIIAAGPTCRRPWLSAVLIVIGSLVKQTAALSAVGIVVYFLLRKQYRTAILYSLFVAALGIAAWSSLIFATDGYFLVAAIRGNMNTMSAYQALRASSRFLYVPVVLASLGVLCFWLVANRRKAAKIFCSIYVVAFCTSALLCTVLSSKEGAGFYYFMEPTTLAALVAVRFGVYELWRRNEAAARYVLLGVVAVALPWSIGVLCREVGGARRPQIAALTLENLKHDGPIRVLADGEYVDRALAERLTLQVNDPYLFRLLTDNGSLPLDPLLDAIDRGDVQYLLLAKTPEEYEAADKLNKAEQRWPPAVLDRMKRYYQLDRKCGNILVFRNTVHLP